MKYNIKSDTNIGSSSLSIHNIIGTINFTGSLKVSESLNILNTGIWSDVLESGVSIVAKNSTFGSYPTLAVGANPYIIYFHSKNPYWTSPKPTIQLGDGNVGFALDGYNYRSWQDYGTYGMVFATKGTGGYASNRIIINGNSDDVDISFISSSVNILGSTKFGYTSNDTHQITGSLNVSGGITGSLFGTSSQAISASYAPSSPSVSSSYSLSSSYALSASYAPQTPSGSYSYSNLDGIPNGIVSGAEQINTGSFTGSFFGDGNGLINLITGSYSYNNLDNIPAGIVSGAEQINTGSFSGSFFGDGNGLINLITGSHSYSNLDGIPVGILSSSIQIAPEISGSFTSTSSSLSGRIKLLESKINIEKTFIAGSTIVSGTICRLDTVGNFVSASATTESLASGYLSIGSESINSGSSGKFILYGDCSFYSGLSIGNKYYLSASLNGKTTSTAPTQSGHIVRILGYGIDSSTIFFDPDNTYLEIL